MSWRGSMIVLLGLSVCAGGCAVPATTPAAGPSDVMVRADEPARVVADNAAAGPAVTTDEVMDWTSRGVGDDVIIGRIHLSRSVFHLSAEQEGRLLEAGVSTAVVRAMDATHWDLVDVRNPQAEIRSNAE